MSCAQTPDRYPSRISLFSATNVVVASMIGAGVYTTSGFALAALGSPLLVLAAWVVGGVLAICGAVSYGALAERFAESGGEYLFLSRALHPAAGTVAGFVSLLAGFTSSIAFAALAFEAYMPKPGNGDAVVLLPGVIATVLVALAALLHSFHVRTGSRVQDALVVIKIVMIVMFLVVAMFSLGHPWYGLQTAAEPASPWPIAAFAVSLMYISSSYSGFNAAIYITGEVHDSGATVRRALWTGTLVVTALYLLLNAVFVLAPPSEMVMGKRDIAAEAARFIGGASFGGLFRATILLSLATSVSSLMMTGPRVYAKMADEGVLPRCFRFVGEAPRTAIIAQAGIAMLAIHLATLEQLLSYLGLTLSLSAALTIASLFVLRHRGENVRVPWYPWPPLVFVSGTLMIAAIAGSQKPVELLVALGTLVLGLIAYGVQKVFFPTSRGR